MKYKKYPKYKDSGVEWIGEIPEDWDVKKIKEISDEMYRYPTYFGITYSDTGILEIRGTLIHKDGTLERDISQYRKISTETSLRFSRTILRENDFVFSVRGTMGKVALITKEFENSNITANLMRLSPKNGIYSLFLLYVFQNYGFNEILNSFSPQTTIKTIKSNVLGSLKITLPPLKQQKQIAEFLDKQTTQFDELIAKSKEQITILEEKRQATITQAVTKGLDPSVPMKDSKILGIKNIPETWSEVNLGLISQLFVPMRDKPKKFDGKIPWLRIEDIKGKYAHDTLSNQYVSENTIKEMNLKVYPVGTVLCSCSATIGFYAITTKELVTNQTFIGIYPDKKLHNEFLYYFLNSQTENIRLLGVGATILYITREKFQKLKITLPPLKQQKQIAEFLDKQTTQFDELIAKSKKQITILEEKRQALITAAVTGKIDVRN